MRQLLQTKVLHRPSKSLTLCRFAALKIMSPANSKDDPIWFIEHLEIFTEIIEHC